MILYPNLRIIRKKFKKTQAEIAALLGTTQKQYSRWEISESEIPAHHLITLADFYHTTTDYLLGRTDTP